jgi:hypothetical protein
MMARAGSAMWSGVYHLAPRQGRQIEHLSGNCGHFCPYGDAHSPRLALMVLRMAVKFLAGCPPNLLQCRAIRLMQRRPLCDLIFERDKRIAELYCPDQCT